MSNISVIPILAFLIHFTHYDPGWYYNKKKEQPFDLKLGCEIIDTMKESGLNMIIIDLGDGVIYKSHPELKRHYSVPMSHLEKFANRAREKGIEVVPKLNFSKSDRHRHNHWFRPYNELPDTEEYWEKAFELIDEIIGVCSPERFFFIGMDEDTKRTDEQYINAIKKLRRGLEERNLRAVMWNDSSHLSSSMFGCVKKTLAAENSISKNVVQVLWDYGRVDEKTVGHIKEIINKGFEVWIAPGRYLKNVEEWKKVAVENGCKGMVMTMWIPTRSSNRKRILDTIKGIGPIYASKKIVKRELEEEAISRPEKKIKKTKKVKKEIKRPVLAPNYLKSSFEKEWYLLPSECYIRNWMILGPYRFDPDKYKGKYQQEVIDDSSFVGGKENIVMAKKEGTEESGAQWKKYIAGKKVMFPQVININSFYGGLNYAVAYLVANVYSPKDVEDYKMYIGSDDYIKVWLDGELIHYFKTRTRSTVQDDDKVENISLRKGWNTVVIKCANIRGEWDFLLRFANEKDEPIIVK